MSLKVSAIVKSVPLPKGEKAVLKVLADHAAHDGTSAFPGVERIARETSYSERHVKRMLRLLEKNRKVIRAVAYVNGGRGRATEYALDLVALEALQSTPRKGDIHDQERVTSAAKKDDTRTPQRPKRSFERSGSAQIDLGEKIGKEPIQNRADQQLKVLANRKDLQNARRPNDDPRRDDFERAIFWKRVASVYSDCVRGGLGEPAAIRDTCHHAALSLTSNRAVELRGIDHERLGEAAFETLQPYIEAFAAIRDYERRERQVVATVIRAVVDAALALQAFCQPIPREVVAARA